MVKIKGQHIHVDICVNGRALESYLDKRLEMNNKYPDHAHRECWEDYYREDSQAIFANPDGQDPERRPRRINKYRYVQARSEQQYTFEIHWGPRFPFKDDSVYIRIYVDDQFADGFHVNKSKLAKRKGHTERRVTAYYKDNGISVKPDLFFTNLKILDEHDEEDEHNPKLVAIGSVRVLMWRIISHGIRKLGNNANIARPQSANERQFRESQFKKAHRPDLATKFTAGRIGGRQPVGNKTFLDEAPGRVPRSRNEEPPEHLLGHPFLDVRLKYRDRKQLQALGIIERSPSPERPARRSRRIKREPRVERGRRTQREQGRAQAGGQALAPPQDGAGSNAAPIEVDDTIAPGDLPTNPIELDDTLRPGDDPTTAIRVDDIPDDDDVVMSIENDLPRLGRHDIGGHDNNLVNGTTGGTNDNDSDLFLPDDPSQSTEEMLQRFQAAQNAQMLRKQRARVNPANQGRSQASSTQHAQQNQAQPGVQSNHRQPHEPASLANIRDNNSLTSNTSSEPTIDLTEDDLMNAIEID